ncbi:Sulfite reductase [ferredoxin] [compost metagenome]
MPVGRLTGDEFEELARLSDEYGQGTLRTTMAQNIIFSDIPDSKVEALLAEPLLKRLTPNPNTFMSRTVSCTGNEFCNLAIVETKVRAVRVAEYLDEHVDLNEDIRIHFVGCPNACGQKQIADIGLQGSLVKTPEGTVDAFDIAIGGTLGPNAQFNLPLKGRVKGDEVGPVLAQLILYYKENRSEEESFNRFVARVGVPAFQELLNGILAAS